MSGEGPQRKRSSRLDEPTLIVDLEYEPSEEAEERLLRAYEFLLGDTTFPEEKERD